MSYAGDITPEQAWKLLSENPEAVLVDVRTDAEWRFVGVPDLASLGGRDVVYIEWNGTDGKHNDKFVADLLEQVPARDDRPVVFLCRSGNRSIGAAEAATDGIYIVRTSLAAELLDDTATVRSYKSLSQVERAFRCIKTVDLHVRPIYHWLADRVRAHVFLCMLAYYLEWHMRR